MSSSLELLPAFIYLGLVLRPQDALDPKSMVGGCYTSLAKSGIRGSFRNTELHELLEASIC